MFASEFRNETTGQIGNRRGPNPMLTAMIVLGLAVPPAFLSSAAAQDTTGRVPRLAVPLAEGTCREDANRFKITCELTARQGKTGPTLTLVIGGDEYVLTRVTPNLRPKASPEDTLRALVLTGDRDGVKEFAGKLTRAERMKIWRTYEHKPFVGTFADPNAKVALAIGNNYSGTLQIDGRKLACRLTPPTYHDPRADYDSKKPFAGGHPLLMDMLTAFSQDGFDLWLNTFLTIEMRDRVKFYNRNTAEPMPIQVWVIEWWLAEPKELMQEGQRDALRTFLKGLNVENQKDLDQAALNNKAFQRFMQEHARLLRAAGQNQIPDIIGILSQYHLFDD